MRGSPAAGGTDGPLRSLEAWPATRGARALPQQAVVISTPAAALYTCFDFTSVATNGGPTQHI